MTHQPVILTLWITCSHAPLIYSCGKITGKITVGYLNDPAARRTMHVVSPRPAGILLARCCEVRQSNPRLVRGSVDSALPRRQQ